MPEGAVYVGRPSLWGNPWSIREGQALYELAPAERASWVVRRYREEMAHLGLLSDYAYLVSDATWERVAALGFGTMAEYARHFLRGHDLVCWCPEVCGVEVALHGVAYADQYEPCAKPRGHDGGHDPSVDPYCHADVLLELANA